MMKRLSQLAAGLARPLALTVCSVYLLVGLEWLFFVTKPSMFDSLPPLARLGVLLSTPLLLALPLVLVQLAIATPLSLLPGERSARWARNMALLIPALVTAMLLLLLIDNFTYTVFGYGIIHSQGAAQWGYAVLLTALVALAYSRIGWRVPWRSDADRAGGYGIAALLLVTVSLASIGVRYATADAIDLGAPPATNVARPNILILSADGLDATHLSLYGAARDTTPRLRAEAPHFALFENAFSNSASTGGSMATLFTGKLPTTTRLINPPDILKGKDTIQHLPAILRQAGYTLAEFGSEHALMEGKNMVDGFHLSNRRAAREPPLWSLLSARAKVAFSADRLFADQVLERAGWRVVHAFGIARMPNEYEELTSLNPDHRLSDMDRAGQLIKFIASTPSPYFAHIHLMGTHGPKYYQRVPTFSQGQEQTRAWMNDFYDDAILAIDQIVGGLTQQLRQSGRLANTILIITSDHGMAWGHDARIPLMINFPGDRFRGHYTANVSRLDIAPTLLHYLQIPQPEWMEGQPLFGGDRDPQQPIFSTVTKDTAPNGQIWVTNDSSPPFFSLKQVAMVVHHHFYGLNLLTGGYSHFDVEGHTRPSPAASLPDQDAAVKMLLDHMRSRGYNVSDIPLIHPITAGPDGPTINIPMH